MARAKKRSCLWLVRMSQDIYVFRDGDIIQVALSYYYGTLL